MTAVAQRSRASSSRAAKPRRKTTYRATSRVTRQRATPAPCSCGERYDQLRTGMTYVEVRRSMDPERWKGRRRSSVLGYWREIKLGLWDHLHAGCP